MAGAYVLVRNGVAVSGTATSIEYQRGEFDIDYAVTTISVERSFAGPEAPEVTIYSADPFFEMRVGSSYLVYANPTEGVEGMHTPVETFLFDHGDGSWLGRVPPDTDPTRQLEVNDDDIEALLEESREFLRGRHEAGSARLALRHGDASAELVVSGFAPGATIALQVCDTSDPGFRPMSHGTSCDFTTLEMLTPAESSFTISYVEPDSIDLLGGTATCDQVTCGLVVYDVGWPDQVFAVHVPETA